MGVKKVWVDCFLEGEIFKSYDFNYEETIGPSSPPERGGLIEEAKFSLSSQRLAVPPYTGIKFEVRYP